MSERDAGNRRLVCPDGGSLSNPQLKLKKAQPERLRSIGLDEPWLQNEIARDTALLNLGELELLKKEKIQAAGGRIDFLMRDPESETQYEIEVMLGEVDESHIIRTIEYWDVERQRYPDLVHYAVIVAEEITARFFNVIRLLNRAVPIIAIRLSAFRLGDEVVLHSSGCWMCLSLRTLRTRKLRAGRSRILGKEI